MVHRGRAERASGDQRQGPARVRQTPASSAPAERSLRLPRVDDFRHAALLPRLRRQLPREAAQRSYGRLARELNFAGCELLVIDAEGHDTRILRSVIAHCESTPSAWPQLIQFETMGHSDKLEGPNAEWSMITELEKRGYQLVSYSHHDSYLVRHGALGRPGPIRTWAASWVCNTCERKWRFPYVCNSVGTYCRPCAPSRSAC
mmetsp:Transcript_64665/g.169317  ORF Transcript_64665/g.169317 Transcript_64665/m.169317 type:complete len:203 (+) Transcript_64665:1656-2264(+)